MNRSSARLWRAALTGAVRHPRLLAGVAAHSASAGDLAAFLARRLDDRTARLLAARVMSRDVTSIEFTRDGLHWQVDLGDEIGEQLYATGGYETEEIAALHARLTASGIDHGTIIDLGANVGTTSIPFALAGFDVLAVEPVPATYAMLVANIEHNHLSDKITPLRRAVARASGTTKMSTGTGSGQAEVATDAPPALERWGGRGELIEVPAGPLSDITRAAADIVLVWADVQGSETTVIETGQVLWETGTPLYLELDPVSLDLHGGLTQFLAAATRNFTSFVDRDTLVSAGKARPIEHLGEFVGRIDPMSFSDALLIPLNAAIA